jgi:malonate-semialdehyde dehydrogenase (acetylating)/methylmalonate-semialdehyde dehydrogenase
MTKTLQHFIDGKPAEGRSGRFADVFNPATGEVAARVPLAGAAEIDRAVMAATAAFPAWAATTPLRRARVMFRFKELVESRLDELAALVTAEHGKVLNDARGSCQRGLEVVEFACGIPAQLKGEFTENVGTAVDSWSMRQPLGVCAGITPFNFPAMVPMWIFTMARSPAATVYLKAVRKRPVSRPVPRRAVEAGRRAGRSSASSTATARLSTPAAPPAVAAHSSARRRSEHIYCAPRAAKEARAGVGRGKKPYGRLPTPR